MKLTRVALAFAVLGSLAFACSSDEGDDDAAAGKGGSAGKAGSGGKAGNAGKGGSSGKAGSAGKGGKGGSAGKAEAGAAGQAGEAGSGPSGGKGGSGGASAGTGNSAGTSTGNAGESGDVYGEPNPVPVGGVWNCGAPGGGGAGAGGAGSGDTCSCEFAVAIDNNAERTCTGSSPCCILSRALTTGVYTCGCNEKTDTECKAAFEDLKATAGYVHIVKSRPTYP